MDVWSCGFDELFICGLVDLYIGVVELWGCEGVESWMCGVM